MMNGVIKAWRVRKKKIDIMLSKLPRVDADNLFVCGVEGKNRLHGEVPMNRPFVGFDAIAAFAPFGTSLMLKAVAKYIPEVKKETVFNIEVLSGVVKEIVLVPEFVSRVRFDSVVPFAKSEAYSHSRKSSVAVRNSAKRMKRDYEPTDESFKCVAHEGLFYGF